jgi:hypothetical protein
LSLFFSSLPSAWSYPGGPKAAITELSNPWRKVVSDDVAFVKRILSRNRNNYLRVLRAALTRFILKQLIAVFGPESKVPLQIDQEASSSSSTSPSVVDVDVDVEGSISTPTMDEGGESGSKSSSSRFTPSSFVEALLESKYSSDKSEYMCAASIEKGGCPTQEDMRGIPSLLRTAVDAEVVRRVRMLGVEGIARSPLGALLDEGVHIPLMMASVEYLSHQALSNENTLSHGDAASRKVCDFVRSCLLRHLTEETWE